MPSIAIPATIVNANEVQFPPPPPSGGGRLPQSLGRRPGLGGRLPALRALAACLALWRALDPGLGMVM